MSLTNGVHTLYSRNGRFLENQYGEGTGQVWLDDIQCAGTESRLDSCTHEEWGMHNCYHSEDVSIVCYDDSNPRGL